jgi:predicted YcjX-like family ATPase
MQVNNRKVESVRVTEDILKQILNQCHQLDDTAISNIIKNLVDKLEYQEKSALLEQLASDVSPEVKASLVKRLLADGGLQVTFGQSHVNVTNFYNIQSASTEQLSDIVLAIADIIRKS